MSTTPPLLYQRKKTFGLGVFRETGTLFSTELDFPLVRAGSLMFAVEGSPVHCTLADTGKLILGSGGTLKTLQMTHENSKALLSNH